MSDPVAVDFEVPPGWVLVTLRGGLCDGSRFWAQRPQKRLRLTPSDEDEYVRVFPPPSAEGRVGSTTGMKPPVEGSAGVSHGASVVSRALRCERCGTRGRVLWVCVDEPENESAIFFGDEVAGMALCGPCVDATEADGPWSAVYRIEPRRPAA